MMEAEDDDALSYTSEGDPLFDVDDNDDNSNKDVPSLRVEDDFNNVSIPNIGKQRRVSGAAVCGGVTGALLSVPLVAIDVTVLAVAGPVVAVAAAGGAALVAANTTVLPTTTTEGESKEEADTPSENESTETKPRFTWVPGVFQRKQGARKQDLDSSSEFDDNHHVPDEIHPALMLQQVADEEEKEDVNDKPANVGLRGGGLMWLMSQRKQIEEECKAEMVSEDVLALDNDEKQAPTTGRGPLGWLAQRRRNQLEAAQAQAQAAEKANSAPGEQEAQATTTEETSPPSDKEVALARRTWMPPVLARRFQRIERDEEGGNSDSSSSYDSDYDSDEDSDYYSDESESEEEEVVFDFGAGKCALFSDGLVEQAHLLV